MRLACVAGLIATPALASLDVVPANFVCDRSVMIRTLQVTETSDDPDAGAVLVLTVENQQVTLWRERDGGETIFSFPSDGSHYVWREAEAGAVLLWHDGTTNAEDQVLYRCTPMAQSE